MYLSMPIQLQTTSRRRFHRGLVRGARRGTRVPRWRFGAVAALAVSAVAVKAAAQPMEHEHAMAPAAHEQVNMPLGIPETRDASGTAWQPDLTWVGLEATNLF